MTTYTWEYGSTDAGLQFTITYDDTTNEFTVTSLIGSFDLNALWFSDGDTTSDGYTLVKSDNNLNMNGDNTVWDDGTSSAETIVWDDYAKLSSPGSVSEDKITFISAGETQTFTLADFGLTTFDPTAYGTLGVKATSVNGDGTIKWVDETPEVGQGEEPTIAQVTNTPVDETLNDISGTGGYLTWAAPGSGGDFDVFWKDIQTGEVKMSGGPGDQTDPHISGDGQHVSFTSDDGAAEIVVWEPATGTLTHAPAAGLSFLSTISDDGNYVAYTQLTAAGSQTIQWNLSTGDTTIVGTSNQTSNPAISGDGNYVAYEDRSFSANPNESEIVVTNVATGESIQVTTNSLQGTQVMDTNPSFSADGNYVAFESADTNGTNSDVFVFDRVTDTLTNVSATVAGENKRPDVSGDGRFVVFSNQSPGGETDVFVWDKVTGDTAAINEPFVQRNPMISEDGRYISYESSDGFQFDIFRADNPLHDDFIV